MMTEQQNITINEADSIWQEIVKAKRILMHCHPSPDGDSLGSTLGLKFALENFFNKQNTTDKKEITLIKGDSDLPSYLSSLPGYETIVKKNFFEVDLNEFDLFLILDSGSLNQITKKVEPEKIIFPSTLKTICIDHHKSNSGFAAINFIDSSYPATCQMIFDLLKKWNVEIPRDAALCLFTGIYTDTGGFKYKPTSGKTLQAAAELAAIAPDFSTILFALENSNTKGRLALEGFLLTSVETFFSDSVALAGVSYELLKEKGITEADAMGMEVANALKSVIGWNIGISLIERQLGIVKISFRSRNEDYDVSKIAVALGGGGHVLAAGAELKGTLQEVKTKIIDTIGQFLSKNA